MTFNQGQILKNLLDKITLIILFWLDPWREYLLVKRYEVKVRWTEPYDLMRAYLKGYGKDDYLYMILRADPCVDDWDLELEYIGMAYDQYVADRLKRHHKLLEIAEETPRRKMVFVKFGQVILPEGRKVSIQLIKDIENALIYWHEPPYNDTGYASYNGRPIKIINLGKYKPLDRVIILPEEDE